VGIGKKAPGFLKLGGRKDYRSPERTSMETKKNERPKKAGSDLAVSFPTKIPVRIQTNKKQRGKIRSPGVRGSGRMRGGRKGSLRGEGTLAVHPQESTKSRVTARPQNAKWKPEREELR